MKPFDAAVVGAGSFGAWTARRLREAGLSVALIDAYGPGNTRASSGGESRIIRMGYGADEIYTRLAIRSLGAWKELSARAESPLFHRTGVLWMGRAGDSYMSASRAAMDREGVPNESLERGDLARRYPQIDLGPIAWGILEPESGALLARRGVQAVVREAVHLGVERFDAAVAPPSGHRRLTSVDLSSGDRLSAGTFVFACGPWLGKLFPDLLGERIFPSRQEVFYFGADAGDARFRPPAMPTWLDQTEEIYGIPDLETRGFKVAVDRHGPRFDPDEGERVATAEGLAEARAYLRVRFPGLAKAPLLSAEVCQYENTSNGDFLIDRHPTLENVWLAGGGSGHGFKHGPAVGEIVTALVTGGREFEPRFRLTTKATVQHRAVH
jgi:monomeric sarcosine oxidase